MTLQDLFATAISCGLDHDFRDNTIVNKARERWRTQGKIPYPDSAILYEKDQKNIKKILLGIDIEGPEVIMAKGLNCQAIIAHHPIGTASLTFYEVFETQPDIMAHWGVNPTHLRQLYSKESVSRKHDSEGDNYNSVIDEAKLYGISLACLHTPIDNISASLLEKRIFKDHPKKLGDLQQVVSQFPEVKIAIKQSATPFILVGKPSDRVGKLCFSEITGGEEGPKQVYTELAKARVKTIVSMHMSEEGQKAARKAGINVLVISHTAADSIGLNHWVKIIEKNGLTVIPCSGYIKV